MKRLIYASALCFITMLACAQALTDYKLYYEQVLRIETAVAGEDFDSAIGLYAELFGLYGRVFTKDAYNACQIAAFKKDARFPDFFLASARAGLSKARLLQNTYIRSAYGQDSAALDKLYLAGYQDYLLRIDRSLQEEFRMRYELEQASKGKADYLDICTNNFKRIRELAEQGRFPGEDLIGNKEHFDSYALPTLLHYPYAYRVLENELWQAVRAGKITPFEVMYLYSFNQTRTSVLYAGIPEDREHFNVCYNLPFGRQSKELEEVDRQRNLRQLPGLQLEKNLTLTSKKYRLDFISMY